MRELAGDTGFPCGNSEVLLKLFVAAHYLNVFKKTHRIIHFQRAECVLER